MLTYFLLSVVSLVIALIPYYIAHKRGAKKSFWLIMGLIFGPLAIPFVFYAKIDQAEPSVKEKENHDR